MTRPIGSLFMWIPGHPVAQATVGLCFTEVTHTNSHLRCQVPGRARLFKYLLQGSGGV